MRRRPAAFVWLVALSGIAVAVSTITPILLQSVQNVALEEAIATAAAPDAEVVSIAQATSGGIGLDTAESAAHQIAGSLGHAWLWGEPTESVSTGFALPWIASAAPGTALDGYVAVAPTGCAHLGLIAGRCPRDAAEVLVPQSTDRRLHARLGSTITVNPTVPQERLRFRVVGEYDDTHGLGRVLADPGILVGSALATSSTSLVVGSRNVDGLHLALTVQDSVPLDGVGSLTDIEAIRSDLQSAERASLSQAGGEAAARVETGLPDLLTHIERQQAAAAVLTGAPALEALALAWFALAYPIQRLGRVRAVEWGIGRTRGSRRRIWLASIFVEPAVAILLGSLAGAVATVLTTGMIARAALGPSARIDPMEPIVVIAAVLAVLGSLVALVWASLRSALLPLPALLRETTEPRQSSRISVATQVGVLLITAVALWSVVTEQRVTGPQVALLTPSLLALSIGILAMRLAVLLMRGGTTRPPRTMIGLVVGRQLARAPSALTAGVMVAVGFSLAAYLLQLAVLAQRLEDNEAAVSVGAATVLHVAAPTSGALLPAVRKADPGGRVAMAVEEVAGAGAIGSDRVVAVDASRLAAITTWRPEWRGADPTSLARRLAPAATSPLILRGRTLRLQLADVGDGTIDEARLRRPSDGSTVDLDAVLVAPDGWLTVPLGPIRDGLLTSGPKALPCSDGCRLISLSVPDVNSPSPQPYGVSFRLLSLSTDTQRAAQFTSWTEEPNRWRNRVSDEVDASQPTAATARQEIVGTGLAFNFASATGVQTPEIEPAYGSATLPALAAGGAALDRFPGIARAVLGADLGRKPLLLTVIGRAPILPRAMDDGVLVDLSEMQRIADSSGFAASEEVWLAPGNHPAVAAALTRQGIRVLGEDTIARAAAGNRREAPVRAATLSVVTAGLAVLLTLLALIAARAIASGSRRRDWATLRAAGVGLSRIAVLDGLEFALPACCGVVLGVAAAVVAVIITATHLPLLVGVAAPPPDLAPPAWALVALAGVGIAAVLLVTLGTAARTVRKLS